MSILLFSPVTPSTLDRFCLHVLHTSNIQEGLSPRNSAFIQNVTQQLKDASSVADGDVSLSGSYEPQPP